MVKEHAPAGYVRAFTDRDLARVEATYLNQGPWVDADVASNVVDAISITSRAGSLMTAMTAATLDQLSGGRMLLGIGSSGPQVAEGWHGQRFGKQIQRTREYVTVVRKALARERLEFDGETITLPLPDGPGKALKLIEEGKPVKYEGVIGPVQFDENGDMLAALHAIMFATSGRQWHEAFNFVNDAGHTENGVYALKANYGFAGLSLTDLRGVSVTE